ncbi:MAG TPA: hypothetical protein VGN23_16600 [Verrucomicrobiae bacterium]
MPWRISHGAVLYRDLFYIGGGPFSQYFNALLFKIFGASILTLVTANLFFVAATLGLVYQRFLAAANAFVATTICLGIVLVFTFNEYTLTGNYNYITPYSHEALHGLLLSIVAIAFLADWLTKKRLWYAGAAGFCAGLVFLTKPDIFFALAICTAAGFVLGAMQQKPIAHAIKSLAVFIAAFLLPLLFFFFLFLRSENPQDSLQAVVFGWTPIFQKGVVNSPFYQWCLGLDQPGVRIGQIVMQSIAVVLIVAMYAFVLKRKETLESKCSPLVLNLILIAPLILGAACFDWRSCGAALPLLGICACLFAWRNHQQQSELAAFPLLWSIFGLILLLKMGLFPRIWHYGFALGMPAFVSAVYLLLWLLPNWLEEKFTLPRCQFCKIISIPLFIGFASLFYQSELTYADKTTVIGRGANGIFAFGPPSQIGPDISTTLAWTKKNIPANATVAVLPEGAMLNFLTGRPNPTPCQSWEPVIMSALGPAKMTTAFEQSPPDYIYLVERDDSEFGVGPFGSPGFGADVMQWVRTNYRTVQLIGDEPFTSGKFGIEILERQSTPARQ